MSDGFHYLGHGEQYLIGWLFGGTTLQHVCFSVEPSKYELVIDLEINLVHSNRLVTEGDGKRN